MEDLGIGIYKITLKAFPVNRVLYVGQSKYVDNRWRAHRDLLRRGKHHNPHLQNIYNKHGFAGFQFELICNCNLPELDAMEQFYIDTLKPECNIVRDVKDLSDRFSFIDEPVMLDFSLPGLELDWKPKEWHRWVYGSGRRGL